MPDNASARVAARQAPFIQSGQFAARVRPAAVAGRHGREQCLGPVLVAEPAQDAGQVALVGQRRGRSPGVLVDLQRGLEQGGRRLELPLVQAHDAESVERDGAEMAVLVAVGQLQEGDLAHDHRHDGGLLLGAGFGVAK